MLFLLNAKSSKRFAIKDILKHLNTKPGTEFKEKKRKDEKSSANRLLN